MDWKPDLGVRAVTYTVRPLSLPLLPFPPASSAPRKYAPRALLFPFATMQHVPPPNDSQATAVNPRTPGGSYILVAATPPPLPQNSASALADRPLTPLLQDGAMVDNGSPLPSVVNDTYDQLTPPAPPLTQAPRAAGYVAAAAAGQAQMAGTHDAGRQQPQAAQPANVDGIVQPQVCLRSTFCGHS